jgi:hypothetical protein
MVKKQFMDWFGFIVLITIGLNLQSNLGKLEMQGGSRISS